MKKPVLSQEYLRSLLCYDEETGLFTWKVVYGFAHSKDHAGSISKEGYVRITIKGKRYLAHVLAWLYMTGEYLTRGNIDHRDTIRSNNAWSNLRRATRSQQNMNANLRSDNQCGAKGVYRRKSGRYAAQIRLPGEARQRWLGVFDTVEEAHAAYRAMAIKHFGEFARPA